MPKKNKKLSVTKKEKRAIRKWAERIAQSVLCTMLDLAEYQQKKNWSKKKKKNKKK
jgi:hypothetical protein